MKVVVSVDSLDRQRLKVLASQKGVSMVLMFKRVIDRYEGFENEL